jgi:EAL domain-containing protein (putative c-di-GMP-specific phosphodiesterase class I)
VAAQVSAVQMSAAQVSAVQASAVHPLARSTASTVLRMLFQPIVDLRSGGVVGYEALARGPEGSPWERPEALFEQARREGRLRELDWACRAAAVRDARACSAGRPGWRLFVNAEPEVLGSTCPEELLADWVGGTEELEVVVEVTERGLLHGPRRLIAAVAELRELGCEIALDDVGSNPASVALLPLIEPDVVKMDATLLRSSNDEALLAALRAVAAYVERSGAVLVAEGIESERDRSRAVALGADWGQGYLFARPRRLEPRDATAGSPVLSAAPARRDLAADRIPLPRQDVLQLAVGSQWVTEHLRWVLEAAGSGAASNVLLLRLPEPHVAPLGFFERLAELQEVCALAVVVLGAGAGMTAGGGAAAALFESAHGADDLVAVLFGPSVCHGTVASRTADGRYDVRVDTRPEQVSALARQFLGQA